MSSDEKPPYFLPPMEASEPNPAIFCEETPPNLPRFCRALSRSSLRRSRSLSRSIMWRDFSRTARKQEARVARRLMLKARSGGAGEKGEGARLSRAAEGSARKWGRWGRGFWRCEPRGRAVRERAVDAPRGRSSARKGVGGGERQSKTRTVDALVDAAGLRVLEVAERPDLVHVVACVLDCAL
eukprot:6214103-Pleurochrysis_carterae.AAC.6